MIKSFTNIVNSMKSYIQSLYPTANTSEGTFLSDVIISAPAKEIESLYNEVESVQLDQSIYTASDTGLEVIAKNMGVLRKSARAARGKVTFYINSLPTSDITIPASTVVSTISSTTSSSIQFSTIQTAVMYTDFAANYFNATTGRYEILVDIEALSGGTSGNVGSGTIVSLVSSISGLNGCTNTSATTGGADTESNDQLSSRIVTRWLGSSLCTEDGIKSAISSQQSVEDVIIVAHGNTGREELGAIDVYIKGVITRSQTENIIPVGNLFENLTFFKQPLLTGGIVSVLSSASGSISSSNYSIVKDAGSYRGSVSAVDKLSWVIPINDSYGAVSVVYNYNGLIEDLQNIFNKTNTDILNANILVKWASEIPIDIEFSMKVLAGFSLSDVETVVEAEISTYLTGLLIGSEIQQADITRIILNVPGVDDVQLPFTTFQSSDATIIINSVGNLQLPLYGYCSAGTLTINLMS
ncbi:MAG: baseplate J/gp47 family protein [Candidatus Omnitrophica bacterium]|jgi:uncharacterized phage protein gp47/JayE|nr:baseplate J/gp47 family protein [Candidatus Omnitrophota bacterium]